MCGLSVENSRLAVQTVCKYLYNHKVYMNAADITEEPTLDEPPQKRKCSSSHIESLYVLPSSHTISVYKQMQASQVERDAALALISKTDDTKNTLHYDTTS